MHYPHTQVGQASFGRKIEHKSFGSNPSTNEQSMLVLSNTLDTFLISNFHEFLACINPSATCLNFEEAVGLQ